MGVVESGIVNFIYADFMESMKINGLRLGI